MDPRPPQPGGPPHAAVFAIGITPFTDEGEPDLAALAAHLRRLGAGGVGVYLAGSGSGEGYTLTRDERRRVLEVGVRELGGTHPVRLMGVEPRTADQMIEMVRDAHELGLDAAQVYSLDMGHGYRPRDVEMEAYLRTVLDDAPLPVVLSIHQSVGYRYPLGLVERVLADYPHVTGLNVTTPDITYLAAITELAAGRARVHVGGPMHALTAAALGADGFLCSEANIAPRLAASLATLLAAGDLAGAHRAYRDIIRLFRATQQVGGIVGTKAALEALGVPAGRPRPPRQPLTSAEAEPLVRTIRELGLVESEGLTAT